MPDQSTILSLPHILPSQAQKHVTHNEALRLLDVMVQLTVQQRSLSAPPASPVLGDRHIIALAPTGAWAGHPRDIALWNGSAWEFFDPLQGWRAYVVAEAAIVVFDGTNWTIPSGGTGQFNLLGVAMAADATNKLAVQSPAALFTNPGGSHQLAINKGAAVDTGSILLQQNYVSRAELGLVGDNNLSVKVSPDGSTFFTALTVDKDNGRAALEQPVRLVPMTGDAASVGDGYLWYNATTGKFRARQSGATVDLIPGASSAVFSDATFRIEDDLDSTKKAVFQAAGIATGTTRTYDLPNASGPLALLSGTQTFSGALTVANSLDVSGTTTVSAQTVSLGTSTAASTVGLGTGATPSGVSKTVNLGTAGLSGSTTTINIGSSAGGALGGVNVNMPATLTGTTTVSAPTATVGTSAAASTIGLATGATTTGVTKAVNIGTAGLSGSTTTIAIGSSVGGALGSIAMNQATTFASTATFNGTTTVAATTATIGTSAAASTIGVGTGATTTGVSKTVNLGTAGLSGSTTTVNIGSNISGALGTTNLSSPTTVLGGTVLNGPLVNASFDRLGLGGATADTTNKFSFNGTNALMNSVASMDLTLNKAAAANDATLSFKTGASARALIGTMASDNFGIKVSANGTVFTSALEIDRTSGAVGLGAPGPLDALLNLGKDNPDIKLFDTGVGGTIWRIDNGVSGNGKLSFSDNTTPRVTMTNDGRMGIGTTSPSQRLHVQDGNIYLGGGSLLLGPGTGATEGGEIQFTTKEGNPSWVMDVDAVGGGRIFNAADGNSNLMIGLLAAGAGVVRFLTQNIERLRIGAAGQLGLGGANFGTVGQALVSGGSAGAAAWGPTLASGTYTPTLTNGANVAASTAFACQFLRVGQIVTVSGSVFMTPTAALADTTLVMSLPIASALTAAAQAGGSGASQTAGSFGESCAIVAEPVTDAASFLFRPVSTAAKTYAFSFTYQML